MQEKKGPLVNNTSTGYLISTVKWFFTLLPYDNGWGGGAMT